MQIWLTRLVLSTVILLLLVIAGYWGWIYAGPWFNQSIHQVVLQGNIPYQQKQLIEQSLQEQALGQFFSVDLHQLKERVEANGWVESAVVSRVWPDRLIVEMNPQIIVARWGGNQVLNHRWQVLDLDRTLLPEVEALPQLYGPTAQAHYLAQLFYAMNALLSREKSAIAGMYMADRGALELYLTNGIKVLLGRDESMQRLQRLLQIYRTNLIDSRSIIARIDARYPHGVAVTYQASAQGKE